MDADTIDAAWHQQELGERESREEREERLWQRHVRLFREFDQWCTETGVIPMKTSQMIQSKFLKKEDFPQPERLTIKGVAIEEVGRGDTRWVVYFNEKTKGVVLNVTKIKQLEATFGDDTDLWIGRQIKIANDPTVMMGQQVVGGIKFIMPPPGFIAPAPVAAPKPAAHSPVPAGDDFNDDIPF